MFGQLQNKVDEKGKHMKKCYCRLKHTAVIFKNSVLTPLFYVDRFIF